MEKSQLDRLKIFYFVKELQFFITFIFSVMFMLRELLMFMNHCYRYAWDDPRRPPILQEEHATWPNSHSNNSGDYDPFTSSQDTQSTGLYHII